MAVKKETNKDIFGLVVATKANVISIQKVEVIVEK